MAVISWPIRVRTKSAKNLYVLLRGTSVVVALACSVSDVCVVPQVYTRADQDEAIKRPS